MEMDDLPVLNFRCLAYQDKDNSFTGVCLDLDIVEEKHQTLQEAILSINDAINSHLEAAAEDNFPPESLRRPAPQKYWAQLKNFITKQNSKITPAQFQFYNYQPYFIPLEPLYAHLEVS
jgi:predicted RNase H-like HicB family nuclease